MYPGTTAAHSPDRVAALMVGTGETLTYGRLEERADRLARAWWDAGLRRGDNVALLTTNDLRAFEVYWAAMRSGLYVTAVNSHLTAAEVAYIVEDCEARVLVVAAALDELATALLDRTPGVRLRLAFGGALEGHLSYEQVRDAADPTPLPDRPRGADMLYSSGTTGRPKGIKPPLPDAQVHEHAESLIHLAQRAWGMGEDTVYLSPAPLYHAAPLRSAAAVQALGGTVVVLPRFDAAAVLDAIEEHRVTHAQFVPTMFVRMLRLDDDVRARHDHSSLRVALHAAAPCPPEVKRRMIEWWGPVLVEYYSSTEANGLTLISSPEWLERPGSVGRAVVGRLRICDLEDPSAPEVPVGTIGTVYFERDEVPFTYHGDPDKTRAAQHPQHPTWSTTGDLGRVDEDGYLFLADRQSFLIISGGVNIYPQEIEGCLALHPAVDDVAVTGVPDEEMGESVHAWVVPTPAVADVDRDELAAQVLDHVRAHLAGYKVPRGVTFVDSLPRTATGKLMKARIGEA